MNRQDLSEASRLLRYALTPTERPAPESHYRVLLDRYRTDVAFAEIVAAIAEGLGLDTHQPSQLGLLISGRIDGPFGVTLDNSGLPIREGASRLQDRRCFGLVLVALVAYAYPNGQALVDTTNATVRPAELERFLERKLAALASLTDEGDEQEAQLGEAARIWLDLPEVLPGTRGRLQRNCRRSYVELALKFLVKQGRARREPTLDDPSDGEAYILNDRFRIGLADVSESLVLAMSEPAEAWGEG